MPIVFELWAECRTPDELQPFAEHVSKFSHTLQDGRVVTWNRYPYFSPQMPSAYYADATSIGSWNRTVQDAVDVTEVKLRTYHHLLTAPPFRHARIDWEAFRPMDELPESVEVDVTGARNWDGMDCVVDNALWEDLGKPKGFVSFRPGYVWSPYQGETYRPLGSGDHIDLLRLGNELFPTLYSSKYYNNFLRHYHSLVTASSRLTPTTG